MRLLPTSRCGVGLGGGRGKAIDCGESEGGGRRYQIQEGQSGSVEREWFYIQVGLSLEKKCADADWQDDAARLGTYIAHT